MKIDLWRASFYYQTSVSINFFCALEKEEMKFDLRRASYFVVSSQTHQMYYWLFLKYNNIVF